jgi:hypothetical protein
MQMHQERVLVVGGRGFFGRLLVDDLTRYSQCEMFVAGRRECDLFDPAAVDRSLDGVRIAICAAGPFQQMPTTLVEQCLERGIHYIDLADDRRFVKKVRILARKAPSAVCTGWSTSCALTGLLTQIGSEGMTRIDSIYIHMAPGNRGARQVGTIASLLHSVGQPFTVFRNGSWREVMGWSEPRDFAFPPPVGRRRGYLVDVPDHELFPEIFAADIVEFRAGSELAILNASLAAMRHTRYGWVSWAGVIQRIAALFSAIGHDWGAIGVEVSGSAKRRISIVAETRAERMAAMPASIMVQRLLSGRAYRGLVSPIDWMTAGELREECERRGFRLIVEEL